MYWIALVATLVAIALLYVFRGGLRDAWRAAEARRAVHEFREQRERIEAKFLDLAAAAGKPKGLRWIGCDWLDRDVTFARDTTSGQLAAFVPVNVRFEAIEGEDMEEVEAVGLLRDAAAVFHYRDGTWSTGGRALFNMNPDEAVQRLAGQFEPVRVEV